MAESALPVEHLMDVHLDVTIPSMIPSGPTGTRVTVQVDGGTFTGPRLKGTVIGPSAFFMKSPPVQFSVGTGSSDGTVVDYQVYEVT